MFLFWGVYFASAYSKVWMAALAAYGEKSHHFLPWCSGPNILTIVSQR